MGLWVCLNLPQSQVEAEIHAHLPPSLSLSLSTIAFPFSSLLLSQCLSVVLCKDDPCLLDCMQSYISISLSGTLFVCALWSVNLVRMWLSLCHYRLTCGQDTLSEV